MRMLVSRHSFLKIRRAVIKIQAKFKAIQQRMLFIKTIKAIGTIQKHCRKKILPKCKEIKKKRYLVKLQSFIRMRLQMR
jgi:hypothetical protein